MARRRRRRKIKKSALDYISIPKIDLDPDVKKGIFIIIILAFGTISLLGLFGLAGSLGALLADGISFLMGWAKWLFPVVLLTLGFLMYNEEKYYVRGLNYLGLFVFLVAFHSFLHYFVPKTQWVEAVKTGDGGGYLGMFLVNIFSNILGFWGGLIVVICLLLISLMLMFETSLSRIVGSESLLARIFYPFKLIFGKLFSRGDRGEDEEFVEEDVEEEIEPEEIADEPEEMPLPVAGFSQKSVSEGEPEFMERPQPKPKPVVKEEIDSGWKPSHIKIDLPMELLSSKSGKPTSGDIKSNVLVIQRTLENFGINVEMDEVSVGPTVTQFTFKPAEGVKLSRITTLSNDLALALAAHPIRIEAPIPGKSLVGIEVPNKTKAMVTIREILTSADFKSRKSNLMFALGKDVAGKSWLYDITKMPHLLVAGATNSGKSVCLNTMIISLLYQNNPDDLKFIMVDPKRVELPVYNGIPHLLTPVITDVNKTINALKWCLNEMDRRFELLSQKGKRNIKSYNDSVKPSDEDGKLPYIVFVIDELADLMVVAARDIETSIIRIAQMARAVGIHLVLATQRPSVDVITGLIKANTPSRIAFSVASGIDSKTILDSLGAEKLLGQGDMLFSTAEISKPVRIQGAYLSDNEIKRVVNYVKERGGEAQYIEGITEKQKVKGMGGVGLGESGGDSDTDDLLEEAREVVVNMGKASASLLQRRLSVGYARAARIIDELEEAGIVGPANGSKPREILITKEQYESHISNATAGVSMHSREEAVAPDQYLPAEENALGVQSGSATVFKADDLDIDRDDEDEEEAEEGEEDEKDEDVIYDDSEVEGDALKSDDDGEDGNIHKEEDIDEEEEADETIEEEEKKEKKKDKTPAELAEEDDEMFFAR